MEMYWTYRRDSPITNLWTTNKDKMLRGRYSINLPEHLPEHHMITGAEQSEKTISKSVADLVWEIAALEEEVVRKELHLLSLYRAAFDQHLGVSPRLSAQVDQELHHQKSRKKADEGAFRLRDIKESVSYNLPTVSDSKRGLSRSSSGHSSLANFLSASIAEYVPKISCKLSEDIIRCISGVYCKLASQPSQLVADFETLSTPSFSSASSTFSLKHRVDSWSPRCHYNAAYNVGGVSVNAQTIQNSIIGCQSHRPSVNKNTNKLMCMQWVRTLFTPLKKSASGSSTHPYALHPPEPLAHFALSTGAFSDPPVRLYIAKKVNHQLDQAKTEFIQASVLIRKQTIFLPKVLHHYAKDAALELPDLVEMACEIMPEAQQKEIRQCLKKRIDKCVEWIPFKSSFRYTIHRSLAD
uniref:DUF547 domain-containing protein n=1 Tax=Leersia perrieri TaxID=77586 RepID=A0A0D9X9Q7_9ORYZ